MRNWLIRNAEPLEAIGSLATAFAALTAVVVIPLQFSQADRIQRDQTAREIYREFLNLTVQKPELAMADFCLLEDMNQVAAYSAYVEYLLYTAEQMVETSDEWRAPMASFLGDHMGYLCSPVVWEAKGEVEALVADLGLVCAAEHQCSSLQFQSP